MTDNTENLVLEMLRLIRSDMTKMQQDIRELRNQGVSNKLHYAAIVSDIAHHDESMAHLHHRMDRIEKRFEFRDS